MTRSLAAAVALAALPAAAAAGVRPAYGGTIRIGVPERPLGFGGWAGVPLGPADLLYEGSASAPLLELDASGALSPGALAEVPIPEAGGRAWRLRLRPGLTDWTGKPLGAADVAALLTGLLSPADPSNAWVALPLLGADEVLRGRTKALAGVKVLSQTELLVTLASPLPEFPFLLATAPAALPNAGPFVRAVVHSQGDPPLQVKNARHFRGRPFADEVELHQVDARSAARLLETGGLDVVLRPEPAGGIPGPAAPALVATVASVNVARLGASAEPLRRALAAVDRAELAHRFVRGAAEPLATIVPPAVLPGAPPRSPYPPPAAGPPARVTILASSAVADHRAIAERLQVKLHDAGIRASLEIVDPDRFRARLASGENDVALLRVPVLAMKPALAAAQVVFAARGAAAARRAMAAMSGLQPEAAVAAADRLGRDLAIVPLVATGWRVSIGRRLQGLAARADGSFDLGDLWLLGGGGP